jgi:UDP-N-acetyl-D-galactosamine dehydrogenase
LVDIVAELKDCNFQTDVFYPWANSIEAQHEYGINLVQKPQNGTHEAIVIALPHNKFRTMVANVMRAFGSLNHLIYDLKYVLALNETDLCL